MEAEQRQPINPEDGTVACTYEQICYDQRSKYKVDQWLAKGGFIVDKQDTDSRKYRIGAKDRKVVTHS